MLTDDMCNDLSLIPALKWMQFALKKKMPTIFQAPNKRQKSNQNKIGFSLIFHHLSVVLWLDTGDFPKRLHTVCLCQNKLAFIWTFLCLDLAICLSWLQVTSHTTSECAPQLILNALLWIHQSSLLLLCSSLWDQHNRQCSGLHAELALVTS